VNITKEGQNKADANATGKESVSTKGLPRQLQATMGSGAQCWGWIGMLDAAGEQWMDVYGILRNAAIYIFDSEESPAESVRYVHFPSGEVCFDLDQIYNSNSARKCGRQISSRQEAWKTQLFADCSVR